MKFGTIIADPPWPYAPGGGAKAGGYVTQNGGAHYPQMKIPDLAALSVGDVAAENSVLLLWSTPAMSADGYDRELCVAWGFRPVTYVYWVKTTSKGNLTYGVGYWFRGGVESVLVGVRGRAYRTHERGVFCAEATGHSCKPPNVHEIAEKHFPGPRLELFAREQRAGWTCVGNELTRRDIREDLALLERRANHANPR